MQRPLRTIRDAETVRTIRDAETVRTIRDAETVRTIRDREPRTSTSSLTQLPSSDEEEPLSF